MMAAYMDLSAFHKIYMVDLCGPLCDVARAKVIKRGWQNVEVVEGDVCDFVPPQSFANLVTFSYSLSSELCVAHGRYTVWWKRHNFSLLCFSDSSLHGCCR